MTKKINNLCNSLVENLHDALPMLLIIVFYQMTVLEIPIPEIVEMLGWVLFISFGMIMII